MASNKPNLSTNKFNNKKKTDKQYENITKKTHTSQINLYTKLIIRDKTKNSVLHYYSLIVTIMDNNTVS